MLFWTLSALLSGYIIGSLHGSLIAQLLTGVNIKKEGVKNSGASNAAIVLGWKYGVLVAFLDIAKGIIAVVGFHSLLDASALPDNTVWALLFTIGAGVVCGHNFPIYMKFDGGKGTAPLIGVMLALDWKFGMAGLILLIIVSLATDYLVFGVWVLYATLLATALFPAEGMMPVIIALLLFAMAYWKHQENIAHIKDGTEKRVSAGLRKNTARPS